MPPHPTRSAFVRASTLSLGSIAFGSLIVTILELVRLLLNWASQNAAEDGNRKFIRLDWNTPDRIYFSCRCYPCLLRCFLHWVH
jgi:hypothetical protein